MSSLWQSCFPPKFRSFFSFRKTVKWLFGNDFFGFSMQNVRSKMNACRLNMPKILPMQYICFGNNKYCQVFNLIYSSGWLLHGLVHQPYWNGSTFLIAPLRLLIAVTRNLSRKKISISSWRHKSISGSAFDSKGQSFLLTETSIAERYKGTLKLQVLGC